MANDAELYGMGKKTRRLKLGESGGEDDDYLYDDVPDAAQSFVKAVAPSPAGNPSGAYEAPELDNSTDIKAPKDFNGNEGVRSDAGGASAPLVAVGGTSQTKPNGNPEYLESAGITGLGTKKPASTASSQNVGHDGVYNGMNREQWRDAWMSSGVNSLQGMKDWLAANGGQLVSDNGTVQTPFGETLDLGGNARGSEAGNGVLTPSWTIPGGGGGSGVDDGTKPPPSFIGPPVQVGGASGQSGAIATPQDAIARLLSGTLGDYTADNIGKDPAVVAKKRELARFHDGQRAQLAEQAAAEGTNASGGFDGRLRQLDEAEAEGVSNFAGQRVADAQRERVDEVSRGLSFATQMDQFAKSLGLDYARMDQQERLALRQLAQQQGQFSQRLGFDYDNLEADQNMRAIIAAMGGS